MGYLLLLFLLSFAVCAQGATYYVRPDGGDASQCTGLADVAWPGSCGNPPCDCAWNHPFQALEPPLYEGVARIAGGDTLLIHNGSYKMGYGAPGSELCDADGSFDCVMAAIPSGPDAEHPTRVLGEEYATGCAHRPELWGSERPWEVLNLTASDNVEVGCLEITDHSGCIEDHNQSELPCPDCTVRCERDTSPYGDWASVGIYAEDSDGVLLKDLDIHGLAGSGLWSGRLSNWTIQRVRIVANGSAGWNGDIGADQSNNSGNMVLQNVEVAWNGCSESYPGKTIVKNTCWGQEAGGYGDGIGMARSGGDWLLEDCRVHHNTSDGVDLLYLDGTASIDVRRLISEGNAGNQLKTAGNAHVENTLLISNCSFFTDSPLMAEGDQCRAGGSAYSIDLHRGSTVTLINNTLAGEGDCLVDVGCNDSLPGDPDPDCNDTENVAISNSLFSAYTDWRQPWENSCFYWWDDTQFTTDPVTSDYDLIWEAKNYCPPNPETPCPGAHDLCCQDPVVLNSNLPTFDGHLTASSPAINNGIPTGAPADDLDRITRTSPPDIGALEYRAFNPPRRVPSSVQALEITSSNHGVDGTLTWDVVSCPSNHYHIVYGTGSGLSNWQISGMVCDPGTSGSYTWNDIPDPSGDSSRLLWFLVGGDNGSNAAGSWGLTSASEERGGNLPINGCALMHRDLSHTCSIP